MSKSWVNRGVLIVFALAMTLVPLSGSATSPPPRCAPTGPPKVVPPTGKDQASILGPAEVRIPPGASRTVPYSVEMPEPPRKADIMFLMDTSSSMDAPICGLQRAILGIAKGLAQAGIDAQFGLAEFRDYPIAGYGTCPGDGSDTKEADYAYRMDRQIGPLDGPFVQELNRLYTSGGGNVPESQLAALHQLVTGDGQTIQRPITLPTPGSRPYCDPSIPSGLQARFRDSAMKIVVNITDAGFNDSSSDPNYPGPGFQDTIQTLSGASVRHVGIYVNDGNDDFHGADLRRMASGTGAIAGSGVDCDGNGVADLRPGDPLVCAVKAFGGQVGSIDLTPSILGIIKSIPDWTSVTMRAEGNRQLISSVTPDSVAMNLLDPHPAHFRVTYKCPGLEGSILTVRLTAAIRGAVAATSSTNVVCSLAPPPVPPPPPKATAQVPVTGQNIAPQVHTQVQGQAQAQLHGAPALAPQSQTQLATQENDYPMSRRTPSAAPALAVAFVTGCAALAFARTQVQTDPIRRKR